MSKVRKDLCPPPTRGLVLLDENEVVRAVPKPRKCFRDSWIWAWLGLGLADGAIASML